MSQRSFQHYSDEVNNFLSSFPTAEDHKIKANSTGWSVDREYFLRCLRGSIKDYELSINVECDYPVAWINVNHAGMFYFEMSFLVEFSKPDARN